MSDIVFGRLVDIAPRDAWAHEAHAFTPWLAANIAHLAEAIGVPLELTGTEVAVERFAADILARNAQDGSIVLIENQLEVTDHTHLGQIMTYLAGLEAQTVIWIAPSFREPHLSAIRWLNQHTADGFSFFAVKVRVVRIADSPLAPVFEVLEKPSGWERQLAATRQAATGEETELGKRRRAFWAAYLARRPDAADAGVRPLAGSWQQVKVIGDIIRLTLWVGQPNSGIFIPDGKGALKAERDALLQLHAAALAARFGLPEGTDPSDRIDISLTDEARWPELIDWMENKRREYTTALRDVMGDDAAGSEA